ncbi:MAG: hypothetical protein ABW122_05060 [Ilumatobacteraceae bacterium]
MAYPPTIPPATRVNATPQVDNHPSDHNTISTALTDIINELGANPSGIFPTVGDRITNLDTRHGISTLGATAIGSGVVGTLAWTTLSTPDWGPGPILTAPAGTNGLYFISLNVSAASPMNGDADCYIFVNSDGYANYIPNGKSVITVNALVSMSPGHQLKFQVYNPTGAAMYFTGRMNAYQVSI